MESNNKRKYTAIYRWTMKRYIPVSIAYWVLLLLALPMEELFVLVTTTLVPDGSLEDYLEVIREPQFFLIITMIIVIFFSTIVSFIAFSYMHNKRCVDFFGSLPVSRRTMFFSRYFGAITLVVIPLLIDGIIGGILTLSFTGFLKMMGYMLLIILAAIGNVTMIAFISLCSGTISDMVISYLALNVAYPICIAICSLFPMSVVPGVSYGLVPANVFTLFTPIAASFTGVFTNDTWIFIIWWIVFTTVLILGCYMLCKRRKAETAQNSSTFSVLSNVVKFITCFAAGFGFGWILSHVGTNFKSITAQYVWFFIGLVIGVMVANILLHLIFYKGMEHYTKSMILCAAVIITAGGFLFFVTTGMFGYDSYIPEKSEIKSVYCGNTEKKFEIDGVDVLRRYSDNQEDMEEILSIHQSIIDKRVKKKGIYPIVENSTIEIAEEYVDDEIVISYNLKSGTRVERIYPWANVDYKSTNSKDDFDDDVKILYSIPYKYANLGVSISNFSDDSYKDGDGMKKLSEKELKRLLDAIKKDYEQNGISKAVKKAKNGGVEINSKEMVYELTIEYSNSVNDGDDWVDMNWYIDESYSNTFKLIKEFDMLNIDMLSFWGSVIEEDYINVTGTKTIYFETPDDWSNDIKIQAVPVSIEWGNILYDLKDKSTNCEKVSDNFWKYEMPIAEDMDSVMFYQVFEDHMNATGAIDNPKDDGKNLLKLTKKKKRKTISDDFPDALYNYEWVSYEKK